MLLALSIDVGIGWPQALFARLGHPVTWIGALIAALDRGFTRDTMSVMTRGLAAVVAAVAVIALAALAGWIVVAILPDGVLGVLIAGVVAWPLIAARSLHDHVVAVMRPLRGGDLTAARAAVAMIVGRDPLLLDEAGVGRAAIESLAENTSDGIVAPIFWGVLLGLPGIAAYKAINTLDSMIGHRTPRHEAFGWAAARIDDVANLVPARLTAVLFAIVSGQPGASASAAWQFAGQHRSPNAGWPEAAMAGALGLRLAGPRSYEGSIVDDHWMGDGRAEATCADIRRALTLYRMACLIQAGALSLLVIATL